MTTPTSNMGLLQAVDGDNSRSYLETSLATSLTTVDTHDHSLANNSKGKLINVIPSGGLQVTTGNVAIGGAPAPTQALTISQGLSGGNVYMIRTTGIQTASAPSSQLTAVSIEPNFNPNGQTGVGEAGLSISGFTATGAVNAYGLVI